MSSVVSLPNHTFTGQAKSSKRLTSIVHIILPETDNCHYKSIGVHDPLGHGQFGPQGLDWQD